MALKGRMAAVDDNPALDPLTDEDLSPEERGIRDRMIENMRRFVPATLRASLLRASLFLAAWELLMGEVVEQVRGFFSVGARDAAGDWEGTENYKRDVLAGHKGPLEASLAWLVRVDGLTHAQADRVRALRVYRNEVAHELPKLLIDTRHEVSAAKLEDVRDLIGVLGRFWGSVEVSINPDFDDREVDVDGIQSGSMILMDVLTEAAKEASSSAASALARQRSHSSPCRAPR